jgi:predicted ATPase
MIGSMTHVRIEELRLSGFRAFNNVRLALDEITVLVGRSGTGKSTLIDAFEFIRDVLTDSLENALDRHGGFQAIRQRPVGADVAVAIGLRLSKPVEGADGALTRRSPFQDTRTEATQILYGFRIGKRREQGDFIVKEEALVGTGDHMFFRRHPEQLLVLPGGKNKPPQLPTIPPEALALPAIACAEPLWQTVLDALQVGIRTYHISPDAIRGEPPIGRGTALEVDGRNAGDVLRHLEPHREDMDWIVRHLAAVTPGITDVRAGAVGKRRLIHFSQQIDAGAPIRFDVGDMSDGMLRCLGILLSIRQRPAPVLVCIDEVESSLHPAALSVLLDALAQSTDRCQILLTSHSSEAVSHPSIPGSHVRFIEWRKGVSYILQLGHNIGDQPKPSQVTGKPRSNALWTSAQTAAVDGDFFGLRG